MNLDVTIADADMSGNARDKGIPLLAADASDRAAWLQQWKPAAAGKPGFSGQDSLQGQKRLMLEPAPCKSKDQESNKLAGTSALPPN